MTLNQWMQKNSVNIQDLAKQIGCSIYAIRKWVKGERTPRPAMQAAIKEFSKGAVTGDDWLPPIKK